MENGKQRVGIEPLGTLDKADSLVGETAEEFQVVYRVENEFYL